MVGHLFNGQNSGKVFQLNQYYTSSMVFNGIKISNVYDKISCTQFSK